MLRISSLHSDVLLHPTDIGVNLEPVLVRRAPAASSLHEEILGHTPRHHHLPRRGRLPPRNGPSGQPRLVGLTHLHVALSSNGCGTMVWCANCGWSVGRGSSQPDKVFPLSTLIPYPLSGKFCKNVYIATGLETLPAQHLLINWASAHRTPRRVSAAKGMPVNSRMESAATSFLAEPLGSSKPLGTSPTRYEHRLRGGQYSASRKSGSAS